jgi:hypothetical protein
MNIWELFGPGTFANTERKLARGEFVDGRELALVLRNNPDAVLPRPIREHMIRWLEGEVNAPRGRKPLGIKGDLRDFLIRTLYLAGTASEALWAHRVGPHQTCRMVAWSTARAGCADGESEAIPASSELAVCS